jgi:cellulose synthase/poly-beta-1,6-N-acetylglucosamine synthase-like glycosyltransferase
MIYLVALLLVYTLLLSLMAYRPLFSKRTVASVAQRLQPVTIIICARNEERTIVGCIESILHQDYPRDLMEVIVVNDASDDRTGVIAKELLSKSGITAKVITNPSRKGKKASLVFAIQHASCQFIVTRDADTNTPSPIWLQLMVAPLIENTLTLVAGPVTLKPNSGLLWALQAIEQNILTMVGGGSIQLGWPFLCSGANMAFSKKLFEVTGKFKNHLHLESGDDVFFLNDVKKTKAANVFFLNNAAALVYTSAMGNFKNLLNQKVRWASKTKYNRNLTNLVVALLTATVNAAWLVVLIYGWLHPEKNNWLMVFLAGKIVSDILLLIPSLIFTRSWSLLLPAFTVGFIYPVYACVVGFYALLRRPSWRST